MRPCMEHLLLRFQSAIKRDEKVQSSRAQTVVGLSSRNDPKAPVRVRLAHTVNSIRCENHSSSIFAHGFNCFQLASNSALAASSVATWLAIRRFFQPAWGCSAQNQRRGGLHAVAIV